MWQAIGAAAAGSGISRAPSLSNWLKDGITTGNWGGTSKERKNQIHDIRTLRRREYQDMVHSLKAAGLNPILATGATPGHASAQQVQTQMGTHAGMATDVASSAARLSQAATTAKKAPSEIESTQMGTMNALFQRANILQQYDAVKQDIATSRAQELMYGQEAIHKGASADKINQEIRNINRYGPTGRTTADVIRNIFVPDDPKATAKALWDWVSGQEGNK